MIDQLNLKQLIISAGYTEVTDYEIGNLFKDIDSNQSGTIDIDEFLAYLYVGDKIQLRSRDTLLQIRKAHLKINNA